MTECNLLFAQKHDGMLVHFCMAVPANKHHTCLNPEGVGSMLRTKINVI